MYAILRASIKHSLGQFNVAPILDFERDANLDTPYHYKNLDAEVPTIQVDGNYNPFADVKPNKLFSTYKKVEPTASWESLYVDVKHDTSIVSGEGAFASSNNEYAFENNEFSFENEEVTSSLFNDEEVEQAVQKTYQIHKKYIVSPIKSGMVIVDQHRAHQRVLYEQFLTNMTVHQASSQQLLFPINLFYSTSEMELIAELQQSLINTGFVFEESNSDHIVISGIPVNSTESEVASVLDQLLSDLHNGIPENSFSQNDTIAKSMAKSLAVKAGTYLTEKEQENLVNGLFACKDPNVSPFQKPTFITMRVEDLDKKFAL
jgi:DNA mismatch repair protein MutL